MRQLLGWLLAALITLHDPLGREIYINAEEIMIITYPDNESKPGVHAKIMIHDSWQYVQETPQQVKDMRDK